MFNSNNSLVIGTARETWSTLTSKEKTTWTLKIVIKWHESKSSVVIKQHFVNLYKKESWL